MSPDEASSDTDRRCKHMVRYPHECRDCEAEADAAHRASGEGGSTSALRASAPEGNPTEPGIYPVWISDADGALCDCALWDGEFWRVWCDAFDPPEWDQIENLNSRVIRWTTPDRSLAPTQADAAAPLARAAPSPTPEGQSTAHELGYALTCAERERDNLRESWIAARHVVFAAREVCSAWPADLDFGKPGTSIGNLRDVVTAYDQRNHAPAPGGSSGEVDHA